MKQRIIDYLEDNYMAGSSGMSSLGSGGLGGNTNKIYRLTPDYHKTSIEKVKRHLQEKRGSNSINSLDNYTNSKGDLSNMSNWFKPEPIPGFKKSPPRGLADKVRRHMELLKKQGIK